MEIDKISAALAKAQASLGAAPKNREVTVKTRTGSEYKFKYATLDGIIEHVRPALTSNGLWFTQTLEETGGKYSLVTTLLHDSGQSIASHTPLLVAGGGNQEFGSALTYMRRYALSAILGIAADDDDDGNMADSHKVTDVKDRKAPAKSSEQKQPGQPAEPRPTPARPFALVTADGEELTFEKGGDYLRALEDEFGKAADKDGFWESNKDHFTGWQTELVQKAAATPHNKKEEDTVARAKAAASEFCRVGKEISEAVMQIRSFAT